MKKILLIPLVAATFAIQTEVAKADDWGCTVLLCLADPRGAMTESECVSPIKKLYRHLAKGGGFPSCLLAGDPDEGKGSFARLVHNPFDECPDGLAPKSGNIAQGGQEVKDKWGRINANKHRLTYSNSDTRLGGFGISTTAPRACVADYVGRYSVTIGSNKNNHVEYVDVYEQVVWQKRKSPKAIDVYIDGKLQQRVRY